MDTSEDISVSRKRHHSGSSSPSAESIEQKKKRIDIDKIEIKEQKCSSHETSEKATVSEQNSTTAEKIQDQEETKKCENETKIEMNGENGYAEENITSSIPIENNSPTKAKNQDGVEEGELGQNEVENNISDSGDSKPEEISDLDSEEEKSEKEKLNESAQLSSDPEEDSSTNKETTGKEKELKILITPSKQIKDTPSKKLTPKQLAKKLEAEKRHQEKRKEREEKMKKKLEEKERLLQEKQKKKEMKEKEIEQKKKEKEEEEEKKRREREDKEQKRKEKKEKEEQKRKEREQEKQKKQQEIEEKNKEKLKEEEKKQKAAAAFVNFFVPKKSEEMQDEKKAPTSNFLEFEVKSDMKLPLPRRNIMSEEEKQQLETYIQNQNKEASYLKDISSGKSIGKCLKTWPYEETTDDDVIMVDLGETICEDKSSLQTYKAKFLYFHENRRPAYYGTWRKKSKCVTPRKPFEEDKELLNYEDDSDDDWEEEEQGESLNGSEDEAEKEPEEERDDYEVDNEFFVPHGHLSDDEVDDEEMARLSPESLKQKLKLLKEEFDQDMKLKTHKLKSRSIGCIWYNRDSSNVEEAVDRYLQPLALITRHTQIVIKSRNDIPNIVGEKKNRSRKEIAPEIVSSFLKLAHGSSKRKVVLAEEFLAELQKSGSPVNFSKGLLIKKLKESAVWEKYQEEGSKRYKFRWCVKEDLREKYELVK